MQKQVYKLPADDLHTIGQSENKKVGNNFVTPGIPDAPFVQHKDMDTGLQSSGTAKLRAALVNQPITNTK